MTKPRFKVCRRSYYAEGQMRRDSGILDEKRKLFAPMTINTREEMQRMAKFWETNEKAVVIYEWYMLWGNYAAKTKG